MRLLPALGGCLLVTLLTSCAPPPKNPFVGFFRGFDTCRQEYADLDARIDAAGARVAAFHRIKGYPYLRTERLLATYGSDLSDPFKAAEWLRRMREIDAEARDYEIANLGLDDFESSTLSTRITNCGRVLASIELSDERALQRLYALSQPPDNYSGVARALGFYPIAARLMQSRLQAAHRDWLAAYAAPLDTPGHLRQWNVQPTADSAELDRPAPPDINVLGYPSLTPTGWRALAERHAPALWIESRDDADVPAAPEFTPAGLVANVARPTVYYQANYTRFGDATLVQLCYFVWFRAPAHSATQPIDGMIWRITLDPTLQPLVYESLHASGRDHRWYPVQPLQARVPEAGEEVQFIAPGLAPARNSALRIAAGTHEIRRVVADDGDNRAARSQYQLVEYESLYTLAKPGGGGRDLFDAEGFVHESRGHDPIGGSASGIRRAGALRQYTSLAIAHVGRLHFDDPEVLASAFVAPHFEKPKPPMQTATR